MGYQYNSIPNIREILKYTPAGTKLYSPEFGTLYLTHEGHLVGDAIQQYRVGGVDYIAMTKKQPPHDLCQFGGVGQYRYEDIDYLFDEYGNFIVYNHHGHDDVMRKKGWRYIFNGQALISDEGCQLFPDEECTWKDWQIKFFKKGNLVKKTTKSGGGLSPEKEKTYVGYFVNSFKDCYGNYRLILSDTVMESVINRYVKHYYTGLQEVELTGDTTFATNQDRMEYSSYKDILLGRKKPEPHPFPGLDIYNKI